MSTLKKYIPNTLSLSRIFVFPPILFYICYLLPLEHISFLYIGLLAGYTDWADGHYARKWKVISEFGKLADPLGDKICTASIVVPLLMRDALPLWIGILILFRDAVIIIGSAWVMLKKQEFKATPSKWSGKIAFTVISVTTLVYYYNYVEWFPFFAALSLLVFIWSLADYSRVFFLKLNNFQI